MAMLLWVKYLEERALNAPGAQVSSRSLTCYQCPSGMFDEKATLEVINDLAIIVVIGA